MPAVLWKFVLLAKPSKMRFLQPHFVNDKQMHYNATLCI